MKKVLAAGLIIITVIGFSQKTYGQGTWGAEAGVNLANIKGDDIRDNTDIRTAFLIGVYYQYVLANSPFILQPELLFSQKGLKYGDDATLKMDYIVAGFLVAYYFELSGQITPFVKAGPYAGFNVTSKTEFNGNEADVDDVNSIDAGVILRAGVQVDRFEFGARFARGLTDAFDGDDGKNTVFGFFVGVGF